MKISAYTILYYDFQFYEDIIKSIYDFVDEIIIVDGPYSYAIDTLKKFNLFYDENNKPEEINNIIKKYSKVKYTYVVCDNEEEKRQIGYNKCSNDLVLLVDTDEFLNIHIDKLNNFINDRNKFVGCVDIYNMCDFNINYNKMVQKYIIFKKKRISALDHLNYLWLVGCNTKDKITDYMSFLPCGTMYHQTLNRMKKNNIVKFIFYVLLYRKNNNNHFNLIDNHNNDDLLLKLPIHEILNIFVHMGIERINIPALSDNNILYVNNDDYILKLNKYKNNSSEFYFLREMKCLKNTSVCFRLTPSAIADGFGSLQNQKTNPIIFFENVMSVNIKLYNIHLHKKYEISEYKFKNIVDDKILLEHNITDVGIYLVIQIDCFETKTDDFIFTIKNIV